MNNTLNNLPSVGQMFRLIVFLILALIVLGLVIALVKMLLPVALLAVMVLSGIYVYKRYQTPRPL
jgi:hypothetical protein